MTESAKSCGKVAFPREESKGRDLATFAKVPLTRLFNVSMMAENAEGIDEIPGTAVVRARDKTSFLGATKMSCIKS